MTIRDGEMMVLLVEEEEVYIHIKDSLEGLTE
jgi:hypothetical protein